MDMLLIPIRAQNLNFLNLFLNPIHHICLKATHNLKLIQNLNL